MKRLFSLCMAFVLGVAATYVGGRLTRADVEAAARVLGLSFDAAEIDSLLPNLEAYRADYDALRQAELPNELAPALVFRPFPRQFEWPTGEARPEWGPPPRVRLPEQREDLAFYSVRQLSELIRTRQISSEELTRFFLDRLKRFDDTLHFVVTLTEARALEAARRADAELARGIWRGPLHGIPYGAKDLFAARGYPTTWGAMPYKDQLIDADAAVIRRLDEAGAVLCAKLSLGALAWGDVWFGGKTRNPWAPEEGSSGSSAGSAAAVAAGCIPFALGTETLGSIVSPSTVCGTTGLRPTFGRVSRQGAMALSWSMDKVGPICRTAEDCALVFSVLHGRDPADPATYDAPFPYDADRSLVGLRVGYEAAMLERDYPFRHWDSLALATLRRLGVELVPVELPELPPIRFILETEAAAAFDLLTRSDRDTLLVRQVRNAWPNVFRAARFVPAVAYVQANRLRSRLIEDMARLFDEHDIAAYVAPSWHSRNLRITNLTGHPAVVVPSGFRNGKPVSITFTGQLLDEATILELAHAFQRATDYHLQHPAWLMRAAR